MRGIAVERLDTVENWIVNLATNNCDPPIGPILRKDLLPDAAGADRHVLLVEVARGLYVHRTSGGRYYARVGSTKRDITPPELARLFQQRGREYVFDEQAVLTATVDDLNRNRLEAFFGRSPTIPWLDLLCNTRVTVPDEHGVDRPTVAGLLVFGREPTDLLASGSIEAACYRGARLSSDDLVHAERLAGPVSDQIDAGIAFVARFTQGPADKPSSDRASHDLDVVDEATVNAVAHRDYAISGSKIRLFLFADRLELYSPGKLPNTITLDDMPYALRGPARRCRSPRSLPARSRSCGMRSGSADSVHSPDRTRPEGRPMRQGSTTPCSWSSRSRLAAAQGHVADSLEQRAGPLGRLPVHLFDSVPPQDSDLPVCRSAVVVQVDPREGVSRSRQIVLGVVPPSSDIVRIDGMAGVLLHPSPNPRHVDLRASGSYEDRMDVVSLSRGSLNEPGS